MHHSKFRQIFRSNRPEVLSTKGILRSFPKFTGLRPATLLKKRLWHSSFPVNFAKFHKTPSVPASEYHFMFLGKEFTSDLL